jgi:hypothetical protein
MKRRRKEISSKIEIEFRLAKLNQYLRQLEDWAKVTRDFRDDRIAASSAVSFSERASLSLPPQQFGALRADTSIGRRQGREARSRRAR